jgi:hypothetical protein
MTEQELHRQVAAYLKLQYPNLIFHSDFAAGVKMTMWQAKKNKAIQSGKSWPDLFIAEPRGEYSGLFIEIKTSLAKVYKKDLTFKKDEHVEAQAAMLSKLTEKGYKATFGCGFDHCIKLVDEYLDAK